ncbi:hypothetical protein Taro_043430 [Colocasia esculenta]|uniref:Uncharacterized protein n=1 Tax=Colocasia esculenta TaxID=4460 RepID=A0A843X0P6_COLES|nr:hypothetical protein [Colocasia esculenta]
MENAGAAVRFLQRRWWGEEEGFCRVGGLCSPGRKGHRVHPWCGGLPEGVHRRESKKLWYLLGPAIFTSICQYSLDAVTQMVVSQVARSSSPPSPSRTLSSLASPLVSWYTHI